jgi:integrase/recombinase XerD
MATVKVLLKQDKAKVNGEAPVYLRITKGRKSKYVSLQLYVLPSLWDSDSGRVKRGYPNSVRVNRFIAQKEADAHGISVDLESKDASVSTKVIKEVLSGKTSMSFFGYAESYLRSLELSAKTGTLDKAKAVISKIRAYQGKSDLPLDEITVFWLRGYDMHLRGELGNCNNTVHSNLKVLRRILNKAIEEDLLPFEKNPFHKFKLKWVKPTKTYLTEDEVLRIESVDINPSHRLCHHRDMFIFSCYTGGLRVSDMLFLKWRNFDGERLVLSSEKTDEQLSILVPTKAKAILERYRTDSSNPEGYIFPCFDEEKDCTDPKVKFRLKSSQTAYYNKNLKIIADLADIDKTVTTHTARHTWATRALRKGLRMEHVSKLMGHQSIKTTQVYAKIVNSDLDKAMESFND